jgi:hypothetical protein
MVQCLTLSALLLCGAAQAQNVLHYRCNTVMKYGPTPCPSRGVPPVDDESDIDIDLDKKVWSFGDAGGGIESQGNSITLLQWGSRKGRDATIDRSTGAFSYQTQSGCLVENQTGTCQPRTN